MHTHLENVAQDADQFDARPAERALVLVGPAAVLEHELRVAVGVVAGEVDHAVEGEEARRGFGEVQGWIDVISEAQFLVISGETAWTPAPDAFPVEGYTTKLLDFVVAVLVLKKTE